MNKARVKSIIDTLFQAEMSGSDKDTALALDITVELIDNASEGDIASAFDTVREYHEQGKEA